MMDTYLTTPFGPRPVKLSDVKAQLQVARPAAAKEADKWQILRDICEARKRLGLRDRAIAVLRALLSFHPSEYLSSERGLVVFPSNAQLSARAHGIAGSTLRENLTTLVDAGIIHRKDSPNGKRYARRNKAGEIVKAFGFDLAPLLVRTEEFARLAQDVVDENRQLSVARENITLLRRDIRKLIDAAVNEDLQGNWRDLETRFSALVSGAGRMHNPARLKDIHNALKLIMHEAVKLFENNEKIKKTDANDAENRAHIQNQNTESILESEILWKREKTPMRLLGTALPRDKVYEGLKRFPLDMVLRGCPGIGSYGPQGSIKNWRDMLSAAVVVRSMMGISPSAYQEACETMGAENAATVVACLFERANHIHSAGGYLRSLTRKARQQEFSVEPMLLALMRDAPTQLSGSG